VPIGKEEKGKRRSIGEGDGAGLLTSTKQGGGVIEGENEYNMFAVGAQHSAGEDSGRPALTIVEITDNFIILFCVRCPLSVNSNYCYVFGLRCLPSRRVSPLD